MQSLKACVPGEESERQKARTLSAQLVAATPRVRPRGRRRRRLWAEDVAPAARAARVLRGQRGRRRHEPPQDNLDLRRPTFAGWPLLLLCAYLIAKGCENL